MYLLYKSTSCFIRSAEKRDGEDPFGDRYPCEFPGISLRGQRHPDNHAVAPPRIAMPCRHFRHPNISYLVDRQPDEIREPGESAKAVVVVHTRGHC